MEIDIAKGHEDYCGFLEFMITLLGGTGVSEFSVTGDIHPYSMVAEHMDAQFLQFDLVFLREHRIRECDVISRLYIISICHVSEFCSRTMSKRCAISRMKASCSLAFRDTAGDPRPRHKIRGCFASLEDKACNTFPALSRFKRMVQRAQ
jgi:hypothetical protein